METSHDWKDKPEVVVGIGEILWDVFPNEKKMGGAPANFAYHMAQLGMASQVVSAIGNDDLGRELIECFHKKNLSVYAAVVPYPTGTVKVELNSTGIPQYQINEGVAWDYIPFTQEVEALAHRTRAVCFGTLAQRSSVSRKTILRFLDSMPTDPGYYRVFDVNLRQHYYNENVVIQSLKQCNILKINDEELRLIGSMLRCNSSGDEICCCQTLLKKYDINIVVLTCGSLGSYVVTDRHVLFRKTLPVEVVDTVGAGDSFTAAFIASMVRGASLDEAHCLATEVSAYVCSQQGAMPSLPDFLRL